MKDTKNPHRMQPPYLEPVLPNATSDGREDLPNTVASNICGDLIAGALLSALLDIDAEETGDLEGVWLRYNVRDIRHRSRLNAKEQGRARLRLMQQKLVGFAVHHDTGDVQFLINHPLVRELIEKEIGMTLEEWEG